MIKLGVISRFDAAHSLPEYRGKCRNIHGHTYTVEVVVEGNIDEKSRFVIDYFDLKRILDEVIDELDHKLLNEIIPYPTSEMIAIHIRDDLKKRLDGVKLVSVRLWEGEDKWVMVE
ncbi:MAG: 6-carboxytetrahydropterin synthase QueD [Candidatus Syntropharchaeia archaeon]